MEENNSSSVSFQAGGALSKSDVVYIPRPADDELYENLKEGNYCYVLTARQMGKTSLSKRVIKRLRDEDFACPVMDITKIGSETKTAEDWYYSFLYQISKDLKIRQDFDAWWEENQKLPPLARFSEYFTSFALKKVEQNIVVFIDEIDSVLSLDQSIINTDDFFGAIRAYYNGRGDNEDLHRLSFVIIGVAAPNDLMKDKNRTPFNIGTPIHLTNFSRKDATPLLDGFKHIETNGDALLNEILYWTGGQPVLTQELCKTIADKETAIADTKTTVKKHVDHLFLSDDPASQTLNLTTVAHRIQGNKEYNVRMLQLHRDILEGKLPKVVNSDYTQIYLKLSGIVHEENGKLVLSNNVYKQKFDLQWVDDILGAIERPLDKDIKRWLEDPTSEEVALRGKVLKEAIFWAVNRNDLSSDERAFLEFSKATSAKAKQKATIRKYSLILLIVAILALGSIFITFYQIKEKNETNRQLREQELITREGDENARELERSKIELENIYRREKALAEELQMAKTAGDSIRIQSEIQGLNVMEEYQKSEQQLLESLQDNKTIEDALIASEDARQRLTKSLSEAQNSELDARKKAAEYRARLKELEGSGSTAKELERIREELDEAKRTIKRLEFELNAKQTQIPTKSESISSFRMLMSAVKESNSHDDVKANFRKYWKPFKAGLEYMQAIELTDRNMDTKIGKVISRGKMFYSSGTDETFDRFGSSLAGIWGEIRSIIDEVDDDQVQKFLTIGDHITKW
jgi:hypothetical protein